MIYLPHSNGWHLQARESFEFESLSWNAEKTNSGPVIDSTKINVLNNNDNIRILAQNWKWSILTVKYFKGVGWAVQGAGCRGGCVVDCWRKWTIGEAGHSIQTVCRWLPASSAELNRRLTVTNIGNSFLKSKLRYKFHNLGPWFPQKTFS